METDDQDPAHPPERSPHPYLLRELAILPPFEEFHRLYQKKLRSFEGSGDSAAAASYERAYRLGEEQLRQLLAEEGRC